MASPEPVHGRDQLPVPGILPEEAARADHDVAEPGQVEADELVFGAITARGWRIVASVME